MKQGVKMELKEGGKFQTTGENATPQENATCRLKKKKLWSGMTVQISSL